MNPPQTLEKILTNYGRTVLQNSRKVESLFKDLCYEPEYKREVNILILALKEDIPQRLLNANPVTEYLKNQLAQKIEDTYSVPVQHGKVAVDTWENALFPNKVKSSNTIPTQPQTPVQPVTSTTQPISELDQGVWTDPNTGLMWARISIGQKWENGQCIGDAKKLNWDNAKKECRNSQLANFNDWRLPTIDELKILISRGKAGYNCPKNILFQPKKDEWGNYWSGSPHAYDGTAWYVGFSHGNSYNGTKNYGSYVRAVRTAKTTPPQPTIQKPVQPTAKPQSSTTPTAKPTQQPTTPPINELDQGVWTDPNTGLMWARISIGQKWENGQCIGNAKKLNWDNAKKECRNSKLANFNDWRLPTIEELKTLMIQNKSGYNCPKNILCQPIKDSWGMYWSISPYTDENSWYSYLENEDDEYYWYLHFYNGNIAYNRNLGNAYVRAVRGQAKITLPQHTQTIQKTVQATAKPQPSTTPIKQPIQPQTVQKPVQSATPTAKPQPSTTPTKQPIQPQTAQKPVQPVTPTAKPIQPQTVQPVTPQPYNHSNTTFKIPFIFWKVIFGIIFFLIGFNLTYFIYMEFGGWWLIGIIWLTWFPITGAIVKILDTIFKDYDNFGISFTTSMAFAVGFILFPILLLIGGYKLIYMLMTPTAYLINFFI